MSLEPEHRHDHAGSTHPAVRPPGAVRSGMSTAALRPAPPLSPRPDRPSRYSSLLRLHGYLRPYLSRWIVMVVVAVLGIGTTIVVPLVTKAVIDGPIAERDEKGLFTLGAFALALGALEAILMFIRRWVVARATLGVEAEIRKDLYAHMQRLPMGFHGHWQSGQLLSRVMNDLSTVRRFLGFGLLFMILNMLQVLVVTAILLKMYWPLGLVVLASTVPIVWLVLNNERKYTAISRRVQDQTGDVATLVEEGAHGVRVIKSFGRGEHVFNRFDAKAVRLYDTSMEKVRLQARFWTLLEVIPTLTLIVVLGFGALAAGQDKLTMGTLVAFITLMLSLVWPIASLGFLLSMTQEAMTAADRITEVFDTVPSIADGDQELVEPRGHLRFESVSFRFPDADEDLLRDLDLDIQPGETVALVGATGAGKTAFTALVPRLQDVTGGRITIDGVDIRYLTLDDLRQIVATAFEDATLFSMSVRENLTLGRPDATQEEMDEALDVAQAHFVRDLPWGLETRIGEQGMSLSGGQRQRLALARAVLTHPKILVLDDTLSALDVHTEAMVEEALRRVLVDVTGIVVAHRASTVLLADKVALLQDGRITAVGTHQELLETVPAYRHLLAADDDVDPDRERGMDDEEPWRDARGATEVERTAYSDQCDADERVEPEYEESRR
jgi:ATP-binding cassette subfamily B protein